jgi:hypothetical protein
MNDDIAPVGRLLYVALHSVGPIVDCLPESEQRVLGIPGAETPMAEHERSFPNPHTNALRKRPTSVNCRAKSA